MIPVCSAANCCRRLITKRFNRIKPFNFESDTQRLRKDINGIFRGIIVFGLMLGLPLYSDPVSERQRTTREMIASNCLKLWIIALTIAKTVFFSIECYFNNLLWPTFASRVCYIGICITGYLLTWFFIINRRKIMASVEKISYFLTFLNPDATAEDETRMNIYLFVGFIGVNAVVISQVKFLFFSVWESQVENIRSYIPFSEGSEHFHFSCCLVLFSAIFSLNITLLTLYVALYLTGAAYRRSAQLLVLYGKDLRKDIGRRYFTAQTANESISLFKQVFACLSEVDNTFGLSAFLIYAEVYLQFWGSFSIFLNFDIRFHSVEATAVGLLCVYEGIILMVYLSFSGEVLRKQSKNLKKEMIALSGLLMSQSPDISTLVMFNLLSRQIKEASLGATVLGMYDISVRLIYSIAGALISYGVIMHQGGANANF